MTESKLASSVQTTYSPAWASKVMEQMKNDIKMTMFRTLALTAIFAPVLAASGPQYLALGDSISFGYHPVPPPPQPASSYIGYPEILGSLTPAPDINLSCPGQSSTTFLDPTQAATSEVPNANCEFIGPQVPGGPYPGWKAAGLPLHTSYSGSQADAAVSVLAGNKSIDLVTISIGGDDLLYVQYTCIVQPQPYPDFPTCVTARLPGALATYASNLGAILTKIRKQGKYHDTIVLVKYYAPSTDPLVTKAVAALNQVMTQVGSQFGATFADAFTAFQIASLPFGGDPCKAGLVAVTPTGCDEHPSPLGQKVIATTVLAAIFGR
jgi:lysophospholipase L1-like esterase